MKTRMSMQIWFLLVLLLFFLAPLHAGNLLMARTELPLAEVEEVLKEAIQDQGYSALGSHRVDVSLVSVGLMGKDYLAVTLEREGDSDLVTRFPELAVYLPLRIVTIAENESTVLVTLNPLYLNNFFKQEELYGVFWQWNKDLSRILEVMREAGE